MNYNFKGMLKNSWNSDSFVVELVALLFLTFFVLIWKWIADAYIRKNKNLFLASTWTLTTFLMIVLSWANSHYLTNSSPTPIGNPIVIFGHIFLQAFNANTSSLGNNANFGEIHYQGIFYLLGGEFIGFILGFFLFFVIFLGIKKLKKPKFALFCNVTFEELFKIEADNSIYYAVKEIIFIAIFSICLLFIPYINTTAYSTSLFYNRLILIVAIFFMIYLSSYFGFFAFNLFIALLFHLINLIMIFKKERKNNQQIKNIALQNKFLIINVLTLVIVSIIIPMLVAIIAVQIAITKGIKLTF